MALDGARSDTKREEILNLMNHFEIFEQIPALHLLIEQSDQPPQTDERLAILHQVLDIGVQIKKTGLLNIQTHLLLEQFLLITTLYSQSNYSVSKLNATINILLEKMQSHIDIYKELSFANADNLKLYIDNHKKLSQLKENLSPIEVPRSEMPLALLPPPPPPPPPPAVSSHVDKSSFSKIIESSKPLKSIDKKSAQTLQPTVESSAISDALQNLKKINPKEKIIADIKKMIDTLGFHIKFNPEMTREEASLLRAQMLDKQNSLSVPLFAEMRERSKKLKKASDRKLGERPVERPKEERIEKANIISEHFSRKVLFVKSLHAAFNSEEQYKPLCLEDPELVEGFANDEIPDVSSVPNLNNDGAPEAPPALQRLSL